MKKRILNSIVVGVVTVLAIAIFAQVWVSAQVQDINSEGLVGSWDVTVTPRDCATGDPAPFPPAFSAVQTYNQGGTMLASVLPTPGILSLDGQGVWSHRKGRQYSVAFRFVNFNPDGTPAGRNVIRDIVTLALDSKTYTSTGTVDILDSSGNLILRGCATTSATRFE